MDNVVQLPQWLDDYIFGELGATYEPRRETMTNISDNKERTLNYLGTYFPRSYAESYCIFSELFSKCVNVFADKTELSVFDFGSGTGGEIFGLLTAIAEHRPNIKKVRIRAFDGNQEALRIYERIMEKFKLKTTLEIENNILPTRIHNILDMSEVDDVLNSLNLHLDLFLTFKAINEFATKRQFEEKNPYEHIIRIFLPKINYAGIMCIEDITTKDENTSVWLPKMLDIALTRCNCESIMENNGFNQKYFVSHSSKMNDESKVAWRIIMKH